MSCKVPLLHTSCWPSWLLLASVHKCIFKPPWYEPVAQDLLQLYEVEMYMMTWRARQGRVVLQHSATNIDMLQALWQVLLYSTWQMLVYLPFALADDFVG